ncbi:MAG: hypothetical protein KGK18_01315, partial [Burkholderiales bacterium]|nr:hypothetical protein [Burkholderiales bacterium]
MNGEPRPSEAVAGDAARPPESIAGFAARPLESIAGFAALLRDHGLKVGVAEQQAMVNAALRVPLERAAQL